jgi:hypothetical protein
LKTHSSRAIRKSEMHVSSDIVSELIASGSPRATIRERPRNPMSSIRKEPDDETGAFDHR